MAGAKPQITPEQIKEAVEISAELDNSGANGQYQAVGADKRAARRVEILSLRLAGFSVEQIAQRVGLVDSTVDDIISDALLTTTNRQISELRSLENDRLDRAQAAIWQKVLEGDLKAVDTFLKLSSHRARINGLNAPTKIDMRVGIRHEMDAALADLEKLMMEQANAVVSGEVIHRASIERRAD